MFGAIAGIASGVIGNVLGSAGGALGANIFKDLVGGLVDKVIDDAPLPSFIKDGMQAAFHGAIGDFSGAAQNLGEMLGGFQSALSPFAFNQLSQQLQGFEDALAHCIDQAPGGAGSAEGQSWLIALAEKLGEMLNEKAEELTEKADELGGEDTQPGDSQVYGAMAKEFGQLMEAVTNAIKTIGDGLTTAARK